MPDHTYSVSQGELERLRKQVSDLKVQPVEPKHTATLIDSMDRLNEALTRLIVVFEGANREMAEDAVRGIHDEHAKLDKILEQNEKIARAVVQLADIIASQRTEPPRMEAKVPVRQPAPEAFGASSNSVHHTDGSAFSPQAPPTGLSVDPVRPEPRLQPQVNASPFPAFPAQQLPTTDHTLQYPAAPSFPAMPHLSPLPQPPQASSFPTLPTPPTPARLPPANQPMQPIRPLAPAPNIPFPSLPTPPAGAEPARAPPRIPALSEQDSFVAQSVSQVQPAYTATAAAALPPPPPPASKRSLLNRFSFGSS